MEFPIPSVSCLEISWNYTNVDKKNDTNYSEISGSWALQKKAHTPHLVNNSKQT